MWRKKISSSRVSGRLKISAQEFFFAASPELVHVGRICESHLFVTDFSSPDMIFSPKNKAAPYLHVESRCPTLFFAVYAANSVQEVIIDTVYQKKNKFVNPLVSRRRKNFFRVNFFPLRIKYFRSFTAPRIARG